MSVTSAAARRNVRQRGQWSLIGLLVSIAIIMILSSWYYAKILKPQAGSHNGVPASEQRAYGVGCSEYQSQLNMASSMYKQDHNDQPPRSFDDLKKAGGITDDMLNAPGCQFELDPSTGIVTDIGHGLAAKNSPPIVLGGGAPAPGSPNGPAAPPPNGQGGPQHGPGGITLPPNPGGSLPANSGGDEGQ